MSAPIAKTCSTIRRTSATGTPRVRGERYDAFIDAYVAAVTRLFPNALLQWEDFAPGNGRRILEKYRDRICTFNDDMQGTGAITLAAAISAVRVCGTPLRNQRVVIFGAGTAGIGIADQIRDAMVREGLSQQDACRRFWCVDRHGLLTTDMALQLQRLPGCMYARPAAEPKLEARQRWKRRELGRSGAPGEADHADRRVHGAAGSFTEEIVKEMAAHHGRPIIFALSNPPALAEAKPSDLIAWTDGRALIATGSPFAPVTYKGVTYVIGQMNNAMLYPGLCLGAIVSRASRSATACSPLLPAPFPAW